MTMELPVSDYEYRQRVRRYRPSSLVPLIAAAGARYWQDWLDSPYRKYTPWALADAARVSLACGNEHRRDATEQDLLQILNAYSQLDDRFLHDSDAHAFLLRMAGQQMTWQVPEYETLARTAALFEQTTPQQPMECLRPGWDTELFGCTLREYAGTAQLAWASAITCAGRFDPAVFDTPDGELIARHVGRDTVIRVLDTHFATTVSQFGTDDQEAVTRAGRDDRLRRYTSNPFRGRPLITGFGPGYLCPVPYLALAKATPWGVYFTGMAHYGQGFAHDLGHLFEQYIGRQLQLLPHAQVLGEITYTSHKSTRKTVDWIVILPEAVLLVEVKSAIPTEPVRLGTAEAVDAIVAKLSKALRQIDATAQLIADHDPALAVVPTDRPVLGLAVTLEPFHIANAGFGALPVTRTPTTVADAAEIENLVTVSDIPPGRLLLDRAADSVRSSWSLDTAFNGHARSLNPILDQAWDSYPWASAARVHRPTDATTGGTTNSSE
jgi:hypothetical protein